MREEHLRRIQMLRPDVHWDYAETRNTTLSLLKTSNPHLVYFYCHGGVNRSGIPYLQVGSPVSMGSHVIIYVPPILSDTILARSSLSMVATQRHWSQRRP